jgi:Gpi18-like mannosyltransferase
MPEPGLLNNPLPQFGPDRSPAEVSGEKSWRSALAIGLSAYLVSRLAVAVGTGARSAQLVVDANKLGGPLPDAPQPGSAITMVTEMLTTWDGLWYLSVVRDGYPRQIPPQVSYHLEEARAAFFPLYPLLTRVADWLLPGGDTLAALAINLLLGACAVVLVGLIARRLYGTEVATYSMVLFAVFPGSFVMSFAYADTLMVVLAAATLLALVDERWLLAGILAALTTATRPNGVAIVGACAVAAVFAIRYRRDWSALWAVGLSPIGFVGFQIFLAVHTGERLAWLRVQREAWGEGLSYGWTAISHVFWALRYPLTSPTHVVTTITVMAMIGSLLALRNKRLPAPMVAYVAVILALMLIPETVTARPRFLFSAFPLVIPVAAWLPRRSPMLWQLLMVGCGIGLVGLTVLYVVHGAIP